MRVNELAASVRRASLETTFGSSSVTTAGIPIALLRHSQSSFDPVLKAGVLGWCRTRRSGAETSGIARGRQLAASYSLMVRSARSARLEPWATSQIDGRALFDSVTCGGPVPRTLFLRFLRKWLIRRNDIRTVSPGEPKAHPGAFISEGARRDEPCAECIQNAIADSAARNRRCIPLLLTTPRCDEPCICRMTSRARPSGRSNATRSSPSAP